jgi:hypothetical protein
VCAFCAINDERIYRYKNVDLKLEMMCEFCVTQALDLIAAGLGMSRTTLRIYDPYYCSGAVVRFVIYERCCSGSLVTVVFCEKYCSGTVVFC